MLKQSFYLFLSVIMAGSVLLAQVKKIEAVKQESSITYKLTHPLHEIEAVSKEGYCAVDADPATQIIKHTYVKVAVTSFNSGNSSRDSHAMEVVDALSFPDAKFVSTNIEQKGDNLTVTGKMTFHGITNVIVFNATAKWSDDKLIITGAFDLSLTAFKVERPSLLMVPVKDNLQFSIYEVFKLK
jgi:polyisoprenoid-binding protein YceI